MINAKSVMHHLRAKPWLQQCLNRTRRNRYSSGPTRTVTAVSEQDSKEPLQQCLNRTLRNCYSRNTHSGPCHEQRYSVINNVHSRTSSAFLFLYFHTSCASFRSLSKRRSSSLYFSSCVRRRADVLVPSISLSRDGG